MFRCAFAMALLFVLVPMASAQSLSDQDIIRALERFEKRIDKLEAKVDGLIARQIVLDTQTQTRAWTEEHARNPVTTSWSSPTSAIAPQSGSMGMMMGYSAGASACAGGSCGGGGSGSVGLFGRRRR